MVKFNHKSDYRNGHIFRKKIILRKDEDKKYKHSYTAIATTRKKENVYNTLLWEHPLTAKVNADKLFDKFPTHPFFNSLPTFPTSYVSLPENHNALMYSRSHYFPLKGGGDDIDVNQLSAKKRLRPNITKRLFLKIIDHCLCLNFYRRRSDPFKDGSVPDIFHANRGSTYETRDKYFCLAIFAIACVVLQLPIFIYKLCAHFNDSEEQLTELYNLNNTTTF
ncbi:unnamed protein product [Gordionus sp. m RMFG-2023]